MDIYSIMYSIILAQMSLNVMNKPYVILRHLPYSAFRQNKSLTLDFCLVQFKIFCSFQSGNSDFGPVINTGFVTLRCSSAFLWKNGCCPDT